MMLMFMKCSANVEAKHMGCYVPAFVELADEDDIGGEVRKIVDVGERPVLAILVGEEHDVNPLDPRGGAIPELHGSGGSGVEVGKGYA